MHGFSKNPRDMKPLKQNLELLGYECIVPDLPPTFKEFDHSALILDAILEELIESNLKREEKVNLVGHSTGGLVIRKFVSETNHISRIGRCVLIATPNKGSKLANLAASIKPVGEICRTLKSLKYDYIEQMDFTSVPDVEIAAIAGNKNNLFLGNLIRDENDGRVELSSVFYPELKDIITLPFGHIEIHHQQETAKWVDTFLRTGKFL
ncbi:MAG: alpha/beta hydrolase [Bacillota bacterium]|nr:alpha/beta hydrolase [Bacillota bacterium]